MIGPNRRRSTVYEPEISLSEQGTEAESPYATVSVIYLVWGWKMRKRSSWLVFFHPVSQWILNALRGLPTSEDLRKTYFWESRRLGAREMEAHAAKKRKSRMERLWRVQWHGTIEILTHNGGNKLLDRRNAFAWSRRLPRERVGGYPPSGSLFTNSSFRFNLHQTRLITVSSTKTTPFVLWWFFFFFTHSLIHSPFRLSHYLIWTQRNGEHPF